MTDKPEHHPEAAAWEKSIEHEAWLASPTYRLNMLATGIYGTEWAVSVGRAAKVNVRTCQRIISDFAAGKENLAARGVLRALRERIVSDLVHTDNRIDTGNWPHLREVFDIYGAGREHHFDGENPRPLSYSEFEDIKSSMGELEEVARSALDVLSRLASFKISDDEERGLSAVAVKNEALQVINDLAIATQATLATDNFGHIHDLIPPGRPFCANTDGWDDIEIEKNVVLLVAARDAEHISAMGLNRLTERREFRGRLLLGHYDMPEPIAGKWVMLIPDASKETAGRICEMNGVEHIILGEQLD